MINQKEFGFTALDLGKKVLMVNVAYPGSKIIIYSA